MSRVQDGTFSLADFLDAFSEHEVQRVLRAYENSVTVEIHCASVGDWTTNRLSKEACTRFVLCSFSDISEFRRFFHIKLIEMIQILEIKNDTFRDLSNFLFCQIFMSKL